MPLRRAALTTSVFSLGSNDNVHFSFLRAAFGMASSSLDHTYIRRATIHCQGPVSWMTERGVLADRLLLKEFTIHRNCLTGSAVPGKLRRLGQASLTQVPSKIRIRHDSHHLPGKALDIHRVKHDRCATGHLGH